MQKTQSRSQKKLSTRKVAKRQLTSANRRSIDLSDKIKGWGSDLDPSVRPGIPMDKSPDLGFEALYPDIEPQIPRAKVHKSIEHMQMTPVFGNVCPPKGLSGLIRNHAFRFSEAQSRHWLYLVLADRVDMIETLITDIARLDIPNIPKEIGMKAMWKHDKKSVLAWSAIGIGALGAVVYLVNRNKSTRQVKVRSIPSSLNGKRQLRHLES